MYVGNVLGIANFVFIMKLWLFKYDSYTLPLRNASNEGGGGGDDRPTQKFFFV